MRNRAGQNRPAKKGDADRADGTCQFVWRGFASGADPGGLTSVLTHRKLTLDARSPLWITRRMRPSRFGKNWLTSYGPWPTNCAIAKDPSVAGLAVRPPRPVHPIPAGPAGNSEVSNQP